MALYYFAFCIGDISWYLPRLGRCTFKYYIMARVGECI